MNSLLRQELFWRNFVNQPFVSAICFNHGDCIGVDKQFHDLVRSFKPEGKIIGHPPDNSFKRAFCKFDAERESKPYLVRNKNIVDESTLLLVIPKEMAEQLRSGTWATYRYAKKQNKPIILIYPNGKYQQLGANV